jgi:hypothetical protein
MADITIKVLEPADEDAAFLTVAEAKRMLGLSSGGDPEADQTLEIQLVNATLTIMRLCNRMMARERLIETWRDFQQPKVYLTHYPVAEQDIEGIEAGGQAIGLSGFELEEHSGKLWAPRGFREPLRVTYSGGYDLPDDAPKPLKHATVELVRSWRASATREAVEGIRMIAHKDSRVIYFDPGQQQKTTTATGGNLTGIPSVDAILNRYLRIQV